MEHQTAQGRNNLPSECSQKTIHKLYVNDEPYIDTIYGQTKCSRRRVFKIRQTMHAREAREDYENQ